MTIFRVYFIAKTGKVVCGGAEKLWIIKGKIDWSDGQLFVPMEWWWSYIPNDGMAMVFENVSPSPSMVFGGINHWQRWFFDGFPISRDQWLTMVTEEEKRVVWDNLQENWKAISSMTLKYFTTNSHSWHTHIIFQVCKPKTFYQPIFWKLLFVFCFS